MPASPSTDSSTTDPSVPEASGTDAADRSADADAADQSAVADAADRSAETETTVQVRATGHVRDAIGTHALEYTFEGSTLRAFLEAFFEDYDVEDLLIAETEAEATWRGWAPTPEELPGTWRKNPEGEQTRAYARVCVDGRFNENLDGLETELEDGDRVSLIYPFMFCC